MSCLIHQIHEYVSLHGKEELCRCDQLNNFVMGRLFWGAQYNHKRPNKRQARGTELKKEV